MYTEILIYVLSMRTNIIQLIYTIDAYHIDIILKYR